MTEDDTFLRLSASRIIYSEHGGYYYFVPAHNVICRELPLDVWGHIYCVGAIYDIIKDKKKANELFTDWLSKTYRQQHIMPAVIQMCDIYATHITETWPESGKYWDWEK